MRKLYRSLTGSRRYGLTAWIVLFTAATAWANWSSYQNDQHDERADRRDDARACIASWEVREQIRDTIQTVATTLVQAAGADPNDPRVMRFNELIAGDVAAIEDPKCDLKAAHRTLEG